MESRGTADGVDADGPAVPRRLRVAAWVLALAALVPPLLATAATVDVLSGRLDQDFFATQEYDQYGNPLDTATVVTLTERWQGLGYLVAADRVLLGPVAVALLLAGLHLAGRGRPAVSRGVRLVAGAAAALSALVAAGVGVVPLVLREDGGEEQGFGGPSSAVLLAGSAGVVGFLLLASLLALALLLVRRPRATVQDWPEPDTAPQEATQAAAAAADDVPAPAPEPEPEPAEVTVPPPPSLPQLSEEDRARYRRPAP